MIRANVEDIDQRDKEIMEIAKSIEDLAIVFKELAVAKRHRTSVDAKCEAEQLAFAAKKGPEP